MVTIRQLSIALALMLALGALVSAVGADEAATASENTLTVEENAALAERISELEAELAELKDMLVGVGVSPAAVTTPAVGADDDDYPSLDWSGTAIIEYQHIFSQPGAVATGRARRARLAAKGALSDDTTYKASIEGTGAGGDVLRELWIEYKASDSSTWKIGQFKMPQGYAAIKSPMDEPLPGRAMLTSGGTWNGAQFRPLATSFQQGVQYTYTDDDKRNTIQAAVFNGNGRGRDENSNKDVGIRYQYADGDNRHQAAVSYRTGTQYAGGPGNTLSNLGFEYRYHGVKHWVEAEYITGQARTGGGLSSQTGAYVQWLYWPDGTKRYATWPGKGSGDEFWTVRLERQQMTNTPNNRATVAWLGYTRFIEDDWKAQLAVAYQRNEQRVYLTNYWQF